MTEASLAFREIEAAAGASRRKDMFPMRILKTLVPALLALAMLGGAALPAVAQGEPTQFADMEGLEKAYARTFTVDMTAMFEAATPESMADGWFALSAMALQFDSEDHAAVGVETLMHEIERSGFAGESGEMEDVKLDVDMEHVARQAEQTVDGMTTTSVVALARDGAYVYVVVGVTFGEDPVPVVTSVLAGFGDADASDDEETFREDGTSEGGLWAKMPAADDVMAEVPSLVTVTDETLYPELSSPAVSTPVRVSRPVVESTPAG